MKAKTMVLRSMILDICKMTYNFIRMMLKLIQDDRTTIGRRPMQTQGNQGFPRKAARFYWVTMLYLGKLKHYRLMPGK